MEWHEICQQNVGSFFSRNILPSLGDSPGVGRTPLLSYLRKYQFSALLPITSKKSLCLDLGGLVCVRWMVRSSKQRSQEAWRLMGSNNWLQVLPIRHKSSGRIGELGWSTAGSLANWSMVSLLVRLRVWEQRCLPYVLCPYTVQFN